MKSDKKILFILITIVLLSCVITNELKIELDRNFPIFFSSNSFVEINNSPDNSSKFANICFKNVSSKSKYFVISSKNKNDNIFDVLQSFSINYLFGDSSSSEILSKIYVKSTNSFILKPNIFKFDNLSSYCLIIEFSSTRFGLLENLEVKISNFYDINYMLLENDDNLKEYKFTELSRLEVFNYSSFYDISSNISALSIYKATFNVNTITTISNFDLEIDFKINLPETIEIPTSSNLIELEIELSNINILNNYFLKKNNPNNADINKIKDFEFINSSNYPTTSTIIISQKEKLLKSGFKNDPEVKFLSYNKIKFTNFQENLMNNREFKIRFNNLKILEYNTSNFIAKTKLLWTNTNSILSYNEFNLGKKPSLLEITSAKIQHVNLVPVLYTHSSFPIRILFSSLNESTSNLLITEDTGLVEFLTSTCDFSENVGMMISNIKCKALETNNSMLIENFSIQSKITHSLKFWIKINKTNRLDDQLLDPLSPIFNLTVNDGKTKAFVIQNNFVVRKGLRFADNNGILSKSNCIENNLPVNCSNSLLVGENSGNFSLLEGTNDYSSFMESQNPLLISKFSQTSPDIKRNFRLRFTSKLNHLKNSFKRKISDVFSTEITSPTVQNGLISDNQLSLGTHVFIFPIQEYQRVPNVNCKFSWISSMSLPNSVDYSTIIENANESKFNNVFNTKLTNSNSSNLIPFTFRNLNSVNLTIPNFNETKTITNGIFHNIFRRVVNNAGIYSNQALNSDGLLVNVNIDLELSTSCIKLKNNFLVNKSIYNSFDFIHVFILNGTSSSPIYTRMNRFISLLPQPGIFNNSSISESSENIISKNFIKYSQLYMTSSNYIDTSICLIQLSINTSTLIRDRKELILHLFLNGIQLLDTIENEFDDYPIFTNLIFNTKGFTSKNNGINLNQNVDNYSLIDNVTVLEELDVEITNFNIINNINDGNVLGDGFIIYNNSNFINYLGSRLEFRIENLNDDEIQFNNMFKNLYYEKDNNDDLNINNAYIPIICPTKSFVHISATDILKSVNDNLNPIYFYSNNINIVVDHNYKLADKLKFSYDYKIKNYSKADLEIAWSNKIDDNSSLYISAISNLSTTKYKNYIILLSQDFLGNNNKIVFNDLNGIEHNTKFEFFFTPNFLLQEKIPSLNILNNNFKHISLIISTDIKSNELKNFVSNNKLNFQLNKLNNEFSLASNSYNNINSFGIFISGGVNEEEITNDEVTEFNNSKFFLSNLSINGSTYYFNVYNSSVLEKKSSENPYISEISIVENYFYYSNYVESMNNNFSNFNSRLIYLNDGYNNYFCFKIIISVPLYTTKIELHSDNFSILTIASVMGFQNEEFKYINKSDDLNNQIIEIDLGSSFMQAKNGIIIVKICNVNILKNKNEDYTYFSIKKINIYKKLHFTLMESWTFCNDLISNCDMYNKIYDLSSDEVFPLTFIKFKFLSNFLFTDANKDIVENYYFKNLSIGGFTTLTLNCVFKTQFFRNRLIKISFPINKLIIEESKILKTYCKASLILNNQSNNNDEIGDFDLIDYCYVDSSNNFVLIHFKNFIDNNNNFDYDILIQNENNFYSFNRMKFKKLKIEIYPVQNVMLDTDLFLIKNFIGNSEGGIEFDYENNQPHFSNNSISVLSSVFIDLINLYQLQVFGNQTALMNLLTMHLIAYSNDNNSSNISLLRSQNKLNYKFIREYLQNFEFQSATISLKDSKLVDIYNIFPNIPGSIAILQIKIDLEKLFEIINDNISRFHILNFIDEQNREELFYEFIIEEMNNSISKNTQKSNFLNLKANKFNTIKLYFPKDFFGEPENKIYCSVNHESQNDCFLNNHFIVIHISEKLQSEIKKSFEFFNNKDNTKVKAILKDLYIDVQGYKVQSHYTYNSVNLDPKFSRFLFSLDYISMENKEVNLISISSNFSTGFIDHFNLFYPNDFPINCNLAFKSLKYSTLNLNENNKNNLIDIELYLDSIYGFNKEKFFNKIQNDAVNLQFAQTQVTIILPQDFYFNEIRSSENIENFIEMNVKIRNEIPISEIEVDSSNSEFMNLLSLKDYQSISDYKFDFDNLKFFRNIISFELKDVVIREMDKITGNEKSKILNLEDSIESLSIKIKDFTTSNDENRSGYVNIYLIKQDAFYINNFMNLNNIKIQSDNLPVNYLNVEFHKGFNFSYDNKKFNIKLQQVKTIDIESFIKNSSLNLISKILLPNTLELLVGRYQIVFILVRKSGYDYKTNNQYVEYSDNETILSIENSNYFASDKSEYKINAQLYSVSEMYIGLQNTAREGNYVLKIKSSNSSTYYNLSPILVKSINKKSKILLLSDYLPYNEYLSEGSMNGYDKYSIDFKNYVSTLYLEKDGFVPFSLVIDFFNIDPINVSFIPDSLNRSELNDTPLNIQIESFTNYSSNRNGSNKFYYNYLENLKFKSNGDIDSLTLKKLPTRIYMGRYINVSKLYSKTQKFYVRLSNNNNFIMNSNSIIFNSLYKDQSILAEKSLNDYFEISLITNKNDNSFQMTFSNIGKLKIPITSVFICCLLANVNDNFRTSKTELEEILREFLRNNNFNPNNEVQTCFLKVFSLKDHLSNYNLNENNFFDTNSAEDLLFNVNFDDLILNINYTLKCMISSSKFEEIKRKTIKSTYNYTDKFGRLVSDDLLNINENYEKIRMDSFESKCIEIEMFKKSEDYTKALHNSLQNVFNKNFFSSGCFIVIDEKRNALNESYNELFNFNESLNTNIAIDIQRKSRNLRRNLQQNTDFYTFCIIQYCKCKSNLSEKMFYDYLIDNFYPLKNPYYSIEKVTSETNFSTFQKSLPRNPVDYWQYYVSTNILYPNILFNINLLKIVYEDKSKITLEKNIATLILDISIKYEGKDSVLCFYSVNYTSFYSDFFSKTLNLSDEEINNRLANNIRNCDSFNNLICGNSTGYKLPFNVNKNYISDKIGNNEVSAYITCRYNIPIETRFMNPLKLFTISSKNSPK